MDARLLSVLLTFPPQAWDAIFPQGPKFKEVLVRHGTEVALDPQPLPPAELGGSIVHGMLASARAAAGPGERGMSLFMTELDDWCGTGYPKWWPKPKPRPNWDEAAFLAGAGIAVLGLAAEFAHNEGLQNDLQRLGGRFLEQSIAIG